jgi:hypothetical protein
MNNAITMLVILSAMLIALCISYGMALLGYPAAVWFWHDKLGFLSIDAADFALRLGRLR